MNIFVLATITPTIFLMITIKHIYHIFIIHSIYIPPGTSY
ncbi:hypothetical protein CBB_A0160 [Clostridium botulinum Bf]|nr:hypothetical protein CBB_A0160 [Clostridium botulinum Bf]